MILKSIEAKFRLKSLEFNFFLVRLKDHILINISVFFTQPVGQSVSYYV